MYGGAPGFGDLGGVLLAFFLLFLLDFFFFSSLSSEVLEIGGSHSI
jgi:hypothetical protein